MTGLPERRDSLWILTVAPSIWAVHFLLCYSTAAVWCAKVAGRSGSLAGARTAVVVYTAVALAGIVVVLWRGYQRHTLGGSTVPHDFDTPEDRHRFLGFATVLLAVLSIVGTIYVALAVVFIETCH